MSSVGMASHLQVAPLTEDRWDDLERLFGPNGACGGCWCMWWRQSRREFEERKGEPNRLALRSLVRSGDSPGVLGYLEGRAVAWCSIAPRERFASLERSPVLRRLDREPVWSLVCLFVDRGWRGRGLTVPLIQEAVRWAAVRGARVVEAYPTAPRGRRLQAVSSFMGVPDLFARAGFVECARPSTSRVVMRRTLA